MSVKTPSRPTPVSVPAPPSSPGQPAGAAPAGFLPSPELGQQLQHLEQAQAEIDRRKAEALARLREIQDRD
jgi:hypothetical protein